MSERTQPLFEAPLEPRSILEIGAGRFDDGHCWAATINRIDLQPGQKYCGVDIGARSLKNADEEERSGRDIRMQLQWAILQASRPGEQIDFIQADAARLPFKNGAFDRVIASNVFGYGIDDDEILSDILHEANRVLQPGGEIVIHDSYRPRFNTLAQLDEWFTEQRLQLVTKPRHITPTKGSYGRYGLATYDFEGQPQHIQDFQQQLFSRSTIWTLGKDAFAPVPSLPEIVNTRLGLQGIKVVQAVSRALGLFRNKNI